MNYNLRKTLIAAQTLVIGGLGYALCHSWTVMGAAWLVGYSVALGICHRFDWPMWEDRKQGDGYDIAVVIFVTLCLLAPR
jgi:hypothetical protein